jgi:hypothetical protein
MGHSGAKHRFGYCSALLRLLTDWVIAIEVIDERNLVDVVGYHRDLKAGPWKPWPQHARLAGDDADMNTAPVRHRSARARLTFWTDHLVKTARLVYLRA